MGRGQRLLTPRTVDGRPAVSDSAPGDLGFRAADGELLIVNERGSRLYVTGEGTLQLIPVNQWLNLRPDGPAKGALRLPVAQLPEHLRAWQGILAGTGRAEVSRAGRASWTWDADGNIVTVGASGVWQLGDVHRIAASRGVWGEVVADLRRLATGTAFEDLPEDVHDVSPRAPIGLGQALFGRRPLANA